jgi:hypothetical protein
VDAIAVEETAGEAAVSAARDRVAALLERIVDGEGVKDVVRAQCVLATTAAT